jgi:hypothetical protein
MKNTQNKNKVQLIHADVYIVRYEDTGKGYETSENAGKSATKYLKELIANPAKDELDGEVQLSLSALAKHITIKLVTVDDNGEDSDGEDDGRWSICFNLRASFEVEAEDLASAKAKLYEAVEASSEDVIEDSIEEYASDFSFEIV